MPRIQVSRNTFSGPAHQWIEMSNFSASSPRFPVDGSQHCAFITICCKSCIATLCLARIPSITPTDLRFPPPSTWRRLSCHTLPFSGSQPHTRQICATVVLSLRWTHDVFSFYIDEHDTQGSWCFFSKHRSRQGICLCTPVPKEVSDNSTVTLLQRTRRSTTLGPSMNFLCDEPAAFFFFERSEDIKCSDTCRKVFAVR